jgi:hypothetical protein
MFKTDVIVLLVMTSHWPIFSVSESVCWYWQYHKARSKETRSNYRWKIIIGMIHLYNSYMLSLLLFHFQSLFFIRLLKNMILQMFLIWIKMSNIFLFLSRLLQQSLLVIWLFSLLIIYFALCLYICCWIKFGLILWQKQLADEREAV